MSQSIPLPAGEMTEERILDTYRTVWNEFYAWEIEYASDAIASLSADSPAWDAPVAEDSYFSQDIDIQSFHNLRRPISGPSTSFSGELPIVQAHPRYQACTPSNQNIMAKRPHYNPFVTALFIPFADEPRFKSKYFLEEFLQHAEYTDPQLRWQSLSDPDSEVIQLQTFLKLRQLGYTMSQIDAEMVLPTADAGGLIYVCEQRDLLEWPGLLKNTGGDTRVIEKWDIRSRVDSMLRQFCPLLGCIQSACPSHNHDRGLNRNIKPALTNGSLRQRIKENCDDMCFTLEGDEYIEIAPRDLMSKDVIELIKLLPDELPCRLAGLCRLSCRDVFAYRSQIFSSVLVSGPIYPDIPSRDPPPPLKTWFTDCKTDNPWQEFTAGKVCDHEGPCHRPTQGECRCHMRKVHCSRNCPCAQSCFLRWKGCKCVWKQTKAKTVPCCGGIRSNCQCRAAHRECDPEVCGSCHAREAIAGIKGYSCANVSLQQGNIQSLEIAAAKYGLGAFATQKIKKDGFIGEYVGEIHGTFGHTSRPYLNRYTGLNYLFDLNRSLALDALTVGNETRYLNHSAECNVIAFVWLVNDEHRIVYHATKSIGKNEELFLDYGEGYWAEGTFEDYLTQRDGTRNHGEGTLRDVEPEDPEFTYGSDTAEGI